jgi:hypothetical protein
MAKAAIESTDFGAMGKAARYLAGARYVLLSMARLTLAIGMLLLTACQLPGSAKDCSTVQIDWVDFIQIGSTQYVAAPGATTTLQESDLGPVVGHVKFKVAGNVCDPNYRPKDGDAAFLEIGTPIYQVNGRPTGEVVAARRNGQILSYTAKAP